MKISSKLLRTAAVLMIVLAAAFGAAACSLPDNVNTTLTIQSEGNVTEEIIEDVADADFTEEELRAYIEASISEFDPSETPSVTLESCSVNGNSVKILLNYASVDVYSRYNKVPCFLGTIADAREAGYDVDQAFLDPSGAPGDKDEIESREKEWKVFICSEAIHLKLPDKILYATDNVSITGRLTATVKTVNDKAETMLRPANEAVVSGSGQTETAPAVQSTAEKTGPHPYSTVAHRYAYIIYK